MVALQTAKGVVRLQNTSVFIKFSATNMQALVGLT